jgi:hypothetical protein
MKTRDGSVIPANLPTSDHDYTGASHYHRFGLYPGDVKAVVYADDKSNVSGDVEYVVTIMGQDYFGVPDLRSAGSIHACHTRIRKGVEHSRTNSSGSFGPTSPYAEKKDGEAVWCLFVRGDGDFPVIIGSRSHLRRKENPDFLPPTAALGQYERYEFNGVEFLIDKDGNFTVKQIGNKDAKAAGQAAMGGTVQKQSPAIKNPEALTPSVSTFRLSSNGDFGVVVNENKLQLQFTKASNKLDILAGTSTLALNGEDDSITAVAKSGATLKLANGKVGLGASGGEMVDLLAQTVEQLIQLLKTLSTTSGNLGYPLSTAQQFATMINDMIPIKQGISSIKGGI